MSNRGPEKHKMTGECDSEESARIIVLVSCLRLLIISNRTDVPDGVMEWLRAVVKFTIFLPFAKTWEFDGRPMSVAWTIHCPCTIMPFAKIWEFDGDRCRLHGQSLSIMMMETCTAVPKKRAG